MMWYGKLKMMAGVLLALCVLGTGVGVGLRHGWAGGGEEDVPVAPAQALAPQNTQPPADANTSRGRGSSPAQGSLADIQKEVHELRLNLDVAWKEISRLKEKVKPPSAGRKEQVSASDFEVIRLRGGHAVRVAETLQQVFRKEIGTGSAKILPVAETNVLLVSAPVVVLQRMRKLIDEALDRDLADSNSVTQTWVIGPLKYGRAAEIAKVVEQLYGFNKRKAGVNVADPISSLSVDDHLNVLVLSCSLFRHQEVDKLVRQLEEVAKQQPSARGRLIRLKHASAVAVAKILRDAYADQTKAAVFVPDTRTNQVVLRCPPTMEADITALIRELDVPDVAGN